MWLIKMSVSLRFDGKVVVVTGAGAGIGKQYALEFAKRGAKVVVNDLGGSVTGEGKSGKAADDVVAEIKSLGGEAAANYDSVEDGEKIITTAVQAFGRVDVIINNAGILRDASMVKMTPDQWDIVMKVHMKGPFSVTRAAWNYMRKQKFGRIINTSSGSGVYGNFGQANYGAAKLGIHGFTNVLAREGEKYNIFTNSIIPVAASRMTQDLFTPEMLELLKPEKIVPLVVFLAHESCKENGGLFEAAGGWYNRLRWQRSEGAFIRGNVKAEDVQKEWTKVNDFSRKSDYPAEPNATMRRLLELNETSPKI